MSSGTEPEDELNNMSDADETLIHQCETKHRLTCVEFPGAVRSLSRCMSALGALPEVRKSILVPRQKPERWQISQRGEKKKLTFRPVPDDSGCLAIPAEQVRTNNLLVRVIPNPEKKEGFDTSFVGIVDRTFRFKGTYLNTVFIFFLENINSSSQSGRSLTICGNQIPCGIQLATINDSNNTYKSNVDKTGLANAVNLTIKNGSQTTNGVQTSTKASAPASGLLAWNR